VNKKLLYAFAAMICVALVGLLWIGLTYDVSAESSQSESEKKGQALADSNLAQWKCKNPDKVANWVEE